MEAQEESITGSTEDVPLVISNYNRTSTHLVVAAGLNNAVADGVSPWDSDFKLGGKSVLRNRAGLENPRL
jgi:hypothetical protein